MIASSSCRPALARRSSVLDAPQAADSWASADSWPAGDAETEQGFEVRPARLTATGASGTRSGTLPAPSSSFPTRSHHCDSSP